jgi:hypothetical protein
MAFNSLGAGVAPVVAIMASFEPRNPRSRTVVTPASTVARMLAAICNTRTGGGCRISFPTLRPPPGTAKCTWLSMKPGNSVPASATRRPWSGRCGAWAIGPTQEIIPLASTRTPASATAAPPRPSTSRSADTSNALSYM